MQYCGVLILICLLADTPSLYLPIKVADRKSTQSLQLTSIGRYGLMRKERPGVPAHLHTGIDIKRPGTNYDNEPIFAIASGTVISSRNDGPYAQVIVAHELNGLKFWTVYEHIAAVRVKPGNAVDAQIPIARFMNRAELNQHGHQFDHFHFEILREAPLKIAPNDKTPTRFYSSYTLLCYNDDDLAKYFYEPISFLRKGIVGKTMN